MNNSMDSGFAEGVAIIGMAGRFPKAKNINEFWGNIINGIECISFYTDSELESMGIDRELISNPKYVKARGHLEDIDMFDAHFFNVPPREAELMDPQHRVCLECAWEALEDAGYDSERYDGRIGVFAGESMNTYLLLNVFPTIGNKVISAGSLQAAIGNDKDSLTTFISYKLNLRGASITVQSSSSTSLTAICVACQSILNYQCDMALAGGVSIGVPKKNGYLYEEGGIVSPDGHCRPFDANSAGFVPGNGGGIVVLKRLSEALEDGDNIYAVIKGFAVNNDGSKKVSYSSPSVDAQAEVIAEAQALAGISPETIGYVEAHGTGTQMGDPIEVAALIKAFRANTDKKRFCALGSVKANIGHLDTAAGVVGVIKACMCLKERVIAPNINFEKPNSKIDFENSPFYVNPELTEWKDNGTPRRAGVTSLGMGGTNAHVVLEEAPPIRNSSESRDWKLLALSAKTATALKAYGCDIAQYIRKAPGVDISDFSYTLQTGRREFSNRFFSVYRERGDIIEALNRLENEKQAISIAGVSEDQIAFLFSGQGAQYINMASDLYRNERVFREQVDKCSEILKKFLGIDLRSILYPKEPYCEEHARRLSQTWLTQPALFVIEYTTARMFMEWGVQPQVMLGHSIGEYAAACISGALSLEDALMLVAERGRLIWGLSPGSMLAVKMSEQEAERFLGAHVSLAAVNTPGMLVLSGTGQAIGAIEKNLKEKGVFCSVLRTSHAFHSSMMEPITGRFRELVQSVAFKPMRIPIVSCITGKRLNNEDISNPDYWVKHLRSTVRFSDGIKEILKEPNTTFVEIGPGDTLSSFVKQHGGYEAASRTIHTIRHAKEQDNDLKTALAALGKLWARGARIDWDAFYIDEVRNRIPLPKYPFEKKRYWIEPEIHGEIAAEPAGRAEKNNGNAAKKPKIKAPYQIKQTIREIWKELLGFNEIDDNDNFFTIGGDSIMVIRLYSKLDEYFPNTISLNDIFSQSTISKQYEHIVKKHTIGMKEEDEGQQLPDIIQEEYIEGLMEDVKKGEMHIEDAIERLISAGEKNE